MVDPRLVASDKNLDAADAEPFNRDISAKNNTIVSVKLLSHTCFSIYLLHWLDPGATTLFCREYQRKTKT